jgi:hypothetical protein
VRPPLGWLRGGNVQVNRNIAYRLAFETASLELCLIEGAMKKLQQEKDRVENAADRGSRSAWVGCDGAGADR